MCTPGILQQRWWRLVISMAIFGMLGWGINAILPGRYTQSADMQITFLYSDDINWDDGVRDAFTRTVGNMIESSQVITSTIRNAQEKGLTLTEAQTQAAIGKEQRFYGWTLAVSSHKADTTRILLESWLAAITATLDSEQSLLLAARTQEHQANQWFACLQQLPVDSADPECSQENADAIAASYQQSYTSYTDLRREIQFLLPFSADFTYQIRQVQQEPTPTPLLPVGITVLIVAMFGMLLALLTIQHPLNELVRRKRT